MSHKCLYWPIKTPFSSYIVFREYFHGKTIRGSLSVRKSCTEKAKEKGNQTVHVSTIWVGQS
mgnify:CR=1 FL=1